MSSSRPSPSSRFAWPLVVSASASALSPRRPPAPPPTARRAADGAAENNSPSPPRAQAFLEVAVAAGAKRSSAPTITAVFRPNGPLFLRAPIPPTTAAVVRPFRDEGDRATAVLPRRAFEGGRGDSADGNDDDDSVERLEELRGEGEGRRRDGAAAKRQRCKNAVRACRHSCRSRTAAIVATSDASAESTTMACPLGIATATPPPPPRATGKFSSSTDERCAVASSERTEEGAPTTAEKEGRTGQPFFLAPSSAAPPTATE